MDVPEKDAADVIFELLAACNAARTQMEDDGANDADMSSIEYKRYMVVRLAITNADEWLAKRHAVTFIRHVLERSRHLVEHELHFRPNEARNSGRQFLDEINSALAMLEKLQQATDNTTTDDLL